MGKSQKIHAAAIVLSRDFKLFFRKTATAALLLLSPLTLSFATGVDNFPPELSELFISPQAVEVTSSAATVNVDLRITDDFSGFYSGTLFLFSPGENTEPAESFSLENLQISGDPLNAVFRVPIRFPRHTEPGVWTIKFNVEDGVGRRSAPGFEDEFPPSAQTQIEVINSGVVDTANPVVTHFGIAPNPIDVSSGSQPLAFDFTLEDDVSGFESGHITIFSLGILERFIRFNLSEDNRVSGTPLLGGYLLNIGDIAYAKPGIYEVRLAVQDAAQFDDRAVDLAELGLSSSFEIINTGLIDETFPELISLSISPQVIDADAAPPFVTVEFAITDDLAGVDRGYVYISKDSSHNALVFFGPDSRISGDALSGQFRVEIPVSEFIGPPGDYSCTIGLYDRALKHTTYYGTGPHYYIWDKPLPVGSPQGVQVQGVPIVNYHEFVKEHFADGAPGFFQTYGYDANRNGVGNLLDFMMGNDVADTGWQNGISSMPVVDSGSGEAHLTFRFPRRLGVSNMVMTPKVYTDLADPASSQVAWVEVEPAELDDSGAFEWVTIQCVETVDDVSTAYFHLHVTEQLPH